MAPNASSCALAHTSASFSGVGSTTVENPVNVSSNIDSASNINVQTNMDSSKSVNSTTGIQVTNSVNGTSVDYGLSGSNVFNIVDSADSFAESQYADAKARLNWALPRRLPPRNCAAIKATVVSGSG